MDYPKTQPKNQSRTAWIKGAPGQSLKDKMLYCGLATNWDPKAINGRSRRSQ